MNITLTVMSDDQSYVQYDCQRITVTNIQFPTLGAPRENAHGAHMVPLFYICVLGVRVLLCTIAAVSFKVGARSVWKLVYISY